MTTRTALIDGDILLYEIGFAAEAGWKGDGVPPFEYVEEILQERIQHIVRESGSEHFQIFLTGKTNFRTEVAKLRPYKERPSHNPFHYYNIKAYLQAKYDCRMVEGFEADDLMAIYQTQFYPPNTSIICTRDKDLRQVPGWHFGWELGNQPQFGPLLVDEVGKIELIRKPNSVKLTGYGTMFFYAQLLLGDSVDTVPGLPKMGAVKAFKTLEGSATLDEAFKRVVEAYKAVYEDDWKAQLEEQGQLLWMVREFTPDNKPVMWRSPE